MRSALFFLPGNEVMAGLLAGHLHTGLSTLEIRSFPDGETYVCFHDNVRDRDVVLVCTLDRPNDRAIELYFAAQTARDLGARRIGLVCPYLSYMRQDRHFQTGDGITSLYFAKWLSSFADWLVTVDPHLHRWGGLDEIYSIPTRQISAAPLIAEWIQNNISSPVVVGPDEESRQWVSQVAEKANAPYVISQKARNMTGDVTVSIPNMNEYRDRRIVIVDDIISTAGTMIELLKHLNTQHDLPVCIGTHGVFTEGAYERLSASAAMVVTTNTITHASNQIDISLTLANAVKEFL